MPDTAPDRTAALVLLGLPASADRAEIARAYRRLACLTHPDRCPDSEAAQRFDALNQAYQVASAAAAEPPAHKANAADAERSPHAAPPREGVWLVAGPVRHRPWPGSSA